MDPKPFDCLRHKVNKQVPAIFTDHMMMVIITEYDDELKFTFTNEKEYKYFFIKHGIGILNDVRDIVVPWFETDFNCPVLWPVSEETLSKVLYHIKKKFSEKSDEEAEIYFVIYCSAMIYIAIDYHKRGVTTAYNIVFLEVYFFSCHYLERMKFKCIFMLSCGVFNSLTILNRH